VMGRIHQVTGSLTLRANYTVSPKFSLQLYAQPFVFAGRFSDYKEVIDPQAASYGDRYHLLQASELRETDGQISVDRDGDGTADYSFGDADLSVRQLHSNLVARWEYRPGSVLFFIWSHDRANDSGEGAFSRSDLSALAHETGEHIVMVKLSYWLGL
jgi:hypothetical protein